MKKQIHSEQLHWAAKLFIMCLWLCNCSNEKKESAGNFVSDTAEVISDKAADSLINAGITTERKNVQAKMGDRIFISKGFAVNTFMINNKKTFSIFATDNEAQITLNYSGPQLPGIYIAGNMLQAGLRMTNGGTYQGSEGQIEFTKFDTAAHKISGVFSFRFININNSSDVKFIDEGKFFDLSWSDAAGAK